MLSFLAVTARDTLSGWLGNHAAAAAIWQGWRDVTSVRNTATTLRARTACVDARAHDDAARSTRKNKRG